MDDPTVTASPGEGFEPTEGPPPSPDGFELLEEVGRGGMGVVYRAHDLTLGREVAVKVLQPRFAADSPTAVRFLDEARITAQLQHPGVPAVYQVGRLGGGRPFLAMKLIKGRTLDELLKAGEPIDALAVFEHVCQAVGYAHARGVVHRDLKPANVMVGAFGEVQVMDWGLSKVLTTGGRPPPAASSDPEATAALAATEIKSLRDSDGSFTQAGSVLGTPAYMAPEQAAGEGEKVDARTDVFGLGAILCAMLTGKPPFDGRDAESVRLNAVRGRTEAAFARLDASSADPGLVALCKRCLAFEPADRPADANEVAAEAAALRRAAEDRARTAEQDRLAAEVRAAEQAKRRTVIQRAATLVAVVLAGGMVTSHGQARRARSAEAAAVARQQDAERAQEAEAAERHKAVLAAAAETKAREQAQAKEAEANAVVKFFEERVFAAARPKHQEGGLGKEVTLYDAVAASLPALTKGFADQPLVEARLRMALGPTFYYLGDSKAAAEQFERARDIYADRLGPKHPDTLRATDQLAVALVSLGRAVDAVRLAEEALAGFSRALPPDHRETFACLNNLAIAYTAAGRHADAARRAEEALAGRRRLLPPGHPDTLATMNNLANCYLALGRPQEAAALTEEAVVRFRQAVPADHPELLTAIGNLAACYDALGRSRDALRLKEEALAGYRRALPENHPSTLTAMNNLSVSYSAVGRHSEAVALAREAVAGSEGAEGPAHPQTLFRLWTLAEALEAAGRSAEAVPVIDECVRRAAGRPVDPGLAPGVLGIRLAHFRREGDPAGCRRTAELWEALGRADAESLYAAARFRAVAAGLYAKAEKKADADAAADRAMGWLKKAVAAGYKNRVHLEQGSDLDALRGREDFKQLMGSLEKKGAGK